MPTLAAAAPGTRHPSHPTTFLAKISPKPSMTPFTNGRNMLIVSEDTRAHARVRTERVPSKTASVVEALADACS